MNPATKIPVGPSTVAGLSTTGGAFVAAVVSAAMGDRSEDTMAAIGVGVVALAGVIWSRTRQALEHLRQPAAPAPGAVHVTVEAKAAEPTA